MRLPTLFLALSLSTVAMAQTQFQVYPGDTPNNCTTFTSRIILNANPGEYCQEYPASFFRGLGETSPGNCEISAIQIVSQDQNGVTQENYRMLLRSEDTVNGGPDTSAAGIICASSVFQLPPAVGVVAWRITITFGTPCAVPCDSSWFVCHDLIDPRPSTADGHTQHFASNTGATGEVARTSAGNHTWAIVKDTAGNVISVSQPSLRVPRFAVRTGCPVLSVGNVHGDPRCTQDPAFGLGGMYPDNQGRGDGIALRVKDSDTAAAGQQALVFMSFSSFNGGFPLPGIIDCASIRIGPAPFIQIAFGANTIGDGSSPVADETYVTPAFLAPGMINGAAGNVWFQAIVARPGLPLPMTNAAGTLLGP